MFFFDGDEPQAPAGDDAPAAPAEGDDAPAAPAEGDDAPASDDAPAA